MFEYPVSKEEADVAASVYHVPGDGDDSKVLCGGLVAQRRKEPNKETTPSAGQSVWIWLESLTCTVKLAESTPLS